MSDFVVRIDTAKLNAKQSAAIAGAIQSAVLSALGNLDLANSGTVANGAITFHPEWYGIWMRSLKDLNDPKVNKQVLNVQARGL